VRKNEVEPGTAWVSAAIVGDADTLMRFCASMWTPEESTRIQEIAKETVPGIKAMALPYGLQVNRGPDAVVEYIKEKLPGLVGMRKNP
jgi:hypothetical protein